MAITVDNSADLGSDTSAPFTASYTVSGTNTLLIVDIFTNATGLSATYNGVAMTQIGTAQQVISGYYQHLFYLVGADTGSNTVSVSGTGSYCRGAAASYNGVDQASPTDSSVDQGTATGASITRSVTTSTADSWLVMGAMSENGSLSAGSGTTLRANHANFVGIFDSNGGKSPAGSYSLVASSSFGAGENWGWQMIAFKAASTTAIKTINGLAKASVKTVNGLAIASVKTWNGLA